jgi:hypothetical protein
MDTVQESDPLMQEANSTIQMIAAAPMGTEPSSTEEVAAGLQILLNQLQQAINISALNLQCSVSNRADNLPLAVTLKGSSMDS